ncbi:MAG: D-alanyl-D-alanine carboxypeptidase/D-alanyl-D-alanine-endopeptidase, partial [Actinomycetota bacterium]|nr:D-alanyl-D-alanine carboxypeptidase/D-alanyl-D-alanine-endopeptidase [Actinomycetota bacterium]
MRRSMVVLGAFATLLAMGAGSALAQPNRAKRALVRALRSGMQAAGAFSGAYVVDLTTGEVLFSAAPDVRRLPASVEKLYTTSTALMRFGPTATLTTAILGVGARSPLGTWNGDLYLRGGGDPTFGSAGFDRSTYGTGASIQQLVRSLVRKVGITGLSGRIVGDASVFDRLAGTPPTGFQYSPYLEGSLSALAFNRGLVGGGASNVMHPSYYAAKQLVAAMRAAREQMPAKTVIAAGIAPSVAQQLATVSSPPISTLIALTNTPSDNFFAEMLLKDLGARFGVGGTTAAGASVVRAELATQFAINPRLNDGSGLSRYDATSPRQVVTLLRQMANNPDFVGSLAVAGQSGTLVDEMQGTIAQGRCRGKTGSLHDVSNLVGYCRARDGHTLAFAFLMNAIYPF